MRCLLGPDFARLIGGINLEMGPPITKTSGSAGRSWLGWQYGSVGEISSRMCGCHLLSLLS